MSAPESPQLLTADEVALYLRTTRNAVYVMAERGQLPGIVRLGRRLLVRELRENDGRNGQRRRLCR